MSTAVIRWVHKLGDNSGRGSEVKSKYSGKTDVTVGTVKIMCRLVSVKDR